MLSRVFTNNILAFFPVNGGKKMKIAFELLLNVSVFNPVSVGLKTIVFGLCIRKSPRREVSIKCVLNCCNPLLFHTISLSNRTKLQNGFANLGNDALRLANAVFNSQFHRIIKGDAVVLSTNHQAMLRFGKEPARVENIGQIVGR